MEVVTKSLRENEKAIVHVMQPRTPAPEWLEYGGVLCLKYVSHWWQGKMVLCWANNDDYMQLPTWPHGVGCRCQESTDLGEQLRAGTRFCAAVPMFWFDLGKREWVPVVWTLPGGAVKAIAKAGSPIFWLERRGLRDIRTFEFSGRYAPPEQLCDPVKLLLSFANRQVTLTAMRFPPAVSSWKG